MAQLFHYEFKNPAKVVNDKLAVYKIHLGSKYFIWKGKSLKGSIEQNFSDIQKLIWSPKPDHIFMPMIKQIKAGRVLSAKVEVMITTDDPKVFLETERKLLAEGKADVACINLIFEPYIPKWLQEQLQQKPAPVVPTRNKAITATLPVETAKPLPVIKKSTGAETTGLDKANKLAAALGKLNGK